MSTPESTLAVLISDIIKELKDSKLEAECLAAAQDGILKPGLTFKDLQKGIKDSLISSGVEKKLRNAVYSRMQKHCPVPHPGESVDHKKEPLTYMRKAQGNWEKRILKSLNSMCTELSVPLAKKRPEKEQRELLSKWTELGSETPSGLNHIRPVYAPKDFLEVILALRNPNFMHSDLSYTNMWGMIQVPLRVKDTHELRLQFSEMAINQCQCGIDDSSDVPQELFDVERNKLGKKVIAANHSPLAQEFSKKGCPVGQRAQLWCQILGVDLDSVDYLYYDQLKTYVLLHELLVDNLIFKDVKLTATNDDQYFVFEDYLYQVLLPFSRDTHVLEHFDNSSASPAKSYIRGKLGLEEFAVIYPPSGVIPFHGFAMYVVPLCFVYNDVVVLYHVFRELYTRHLYKLHTISSDPQSIVSLCLLFESLLQTNEPQLFHHLKSISAPPLKIAFKWLIRAFSGYLASDQVLLLWDRILAYDSLEIIAVLASSIFSFRKSNLMQISTYSAAEAVLADLTTLQVVPLIQLSLFTS